MDASDIARHVGDAVAPTGSVAAVYLFGSVAAGTDSPTSDVDPGIEGDLERRLRRPVHVVVLNGAPADLRIRVLAIR